MMRMLRHEPSRGIGGETDKRYAFARRAAVPSGGNAVKITEDVRKYAAEPSGARQIIRRMTRRASGEASQQAISEEEALAKGMEEKSREFVETGAEVYTTAK
jgi:hypothetical protein